VGAVSRAALEIRAPQRAARRARGVERRFGAGEQGAATPSAPANEISGEGATAVTAAPK
jgi:hypothetical protein